MPRASLPWVAAIVAVSSSTPALADLSWSANLGVGQSDNIGRTETDEVSETMATAGLQFSADAQGPRLSGSVASDLYYIEYLGNEFEGELLGALDASGTLRLIEERLSWTAQDTFGQTRGDPFQPSTPGTRANVNYFTTGPDLFLPLTDATGLRLFGRYSSTNSEDNTLDGDRRSFGLELARQLSRRTTIGLHGQTERIEYDNGIFESSYDRHQTFFRFDTEGARTTLTVDAGYNVLDLPSGDSSAPLWSVGISRNLSPSMTLGLTASSRFSDAADSLRGAAPEVVETGDDPDITSTSDPFESRSYVLDWAFTRSRTTLGVTVARSEDVYETLSTLDRKRTTYGVTGTRRLAPALTVGLDVSRTEEDFDTAVVDISETSYALRTMWQFGRQMAMELVLQRSERDASGTSGYEENRAILTFSYLSGRATAP